MASRHCLQHRKYTYLSAVGIIGILGVASPAIAQSITPDSSLGNERSIVVPGTNLQGLPANLIEGGATRGSALFHSFSDFNVNAGERVYFANPAGIVNILSRVTGATRSDILGTLGVNGSANLFLINPNGIYFGREARLDIAGSFLASTANSFVFDNTVEFSATNPQAPPLLSINVRPGLQYGGTGQTATIANTGTLTTGQDLTLAAGNLDLQGQLQAGGTLTLRALDTLRIRDSATEPFVAAASGELLVQGDRAVDIFALNHPTSGFFSGGNMTLRSANTVSGDAHYWSGGSFEIEQLDGRAGNLFSPYDPVIIASGNVSFQSYSGASLHILAGGSVTISGDITITGPDTFLDTINPLNPDPTLAALATVVLSDGTSYAIDGSSQPTLDIRAGVTGISASTLVDVFPFGTFTPTPSVTVPITNSNITIGNVRIVTLAGGADGRVLLTNYDRNFTALPGSIQTGAILAFGGSTIAIDSLGSITTTGEINTSAGLNAGDGGDIRLLAGIGGIDTQASVVTAGADAGNGGDITFISAGGIRTGRIESYISSNGTGDAGAISLTALGDIVIGGNIASFVQTNGTGNGGDITLSSLLGSIDTRGGTINSSTADGFSGDITFTALGTIITGTNDPNGNAAIGSYVAQGGTGFAGDVSLTSTAGDIITTLGTINSASPAGGGSGDITLTAEAGSIFPGDIESFSNGSDPGGDIKLLAGDSIFLDGVRFSANNNGSGLAGNVTLTARNRVEIANNSEIRSDSNNDNTSTFNTITITATEGTVLLDQATVSATNNGTGTTGSDRGYSGDVAIDARDAILINQSGLVSTGYFGRILLGQTIVPSQIILTDRSELTTSNTDTQRAGNILITANDLISATQSRITSTSSTTETSAGFGFIQLNAINGSVVLDNATVSTTNSGAGYAGDISIGARDRIFASNDSLVASDGNFGQILIGQSNTYSNSISPTTIQIVDSEFSTTNSNTAPASNRQRAGNINLDAIGDITITRSIVSSQTSGVNADAGNIGVEAQSLTLDQSVLGVGTAGEGDAGRVFIQVDDTVRLTNSSTIRSNVEQEGIGNAGGVFLTGRSLILTNGAQIQAGVFRSGTDPRTGAPIAGGRGQGGSIDITMSDGVDISGFSTVRSGLFVSTESGAQGDAGSITVNTNTFQISNGGLVNAATNNASNAGIITINANTLDVNNQGRIQSLSTSSGLARNIILNADTINLSNEGVITVNGEGTGNPGNIQISTNSMTLRDRGRIQAESNSGSNANIVIQLVSPQSLLSMSGASEISAEARNNGTGGNITIIGGRLIQSDGLRNDNDIVANAFQGPGGRVDIVGAPYVGFVESRSRSSPPSDITASSILNVNGIVNADPVTVPAVPLPVNLVDRTNLISQGCRPGAQEIAGEFKITGRGGVPADPTQPLNNEDSQVGWVALGAEGAGDRATQAQPTPSGMINSSAVEIIEAQSWVTDANGKIVLVAQAAHPLPQTAQLNTVPVCTATQSASP